METKVSTLCTDPWTATNRRRSLKADPAAQLALLDLQELDSRADLLRHQRETLPELAEIAALTASRAELDGKRRDAQISVDDLTAEQAKVDADVEQVKTRRTRDQDRMAQGLIANPKDLERMQGELESLQRRITSLEDDELEVMARLEDAEKELDSLTAGGRRRRPAAGRAQQRARRRGRRRSTATCSRSQRTVVPPWPASRTTCWRSTTGCVPRRTASP